MTIAMRALLDPIIKFVPERIQGLKPTPKNAQGVEIELEFNEPTIYGVLPGWKYKKDGSLRGNGVEFLFSKPLAGKAIKTAFDNFELISKDWKLVDSIRTSTHIHHNVQEKTGLDILSIFGLYWIVEDILLDYCGAYRKGNFNCLSIGQTNSLLDFFCSNLRTFTNEPKLKKNYQNKTHIYNCCNDHYRYSALNPKSITQFGSIEFRAMRSLIKADDLLAWSNIIQKLITYQEKHGTIDIILKRLNLITPREIIKDIFGPYSYELFKSAATNWEDELVENVLKVTHLKNSLFTWDKETLNNFYKELKKNYDEFNKTDLFGDPFLNIKPIKPQPWADLAFPNPEEHIELPDYLPAAQQGLDVPYPSWSFNKEQRMEIERFLRKNNLTPDRFLKFRAANDKEREELKPNWCYHTITETHLARGYAQPPFRYRFIHTNFPSFRTEEGIQKLVHQQQFGLWRMDIIKPDDTVEYSWRLRHERMKPQ